MANIALSSPISKSFVHTTTTVGTSAVKIVNNADTSTRRISLIIQNQSATATVKLIFSDTAGTEGIIIQPSTVYAIENYNGAVWAIASAVSTPVHTAVATI